MQHYVIHYRFSNDDHDDCHSIWNVKGGVPVNEDEIKELAKPLQEWLASNYNPMCSIIVQTDRVEIQSSEMIVITLNTLHSM